MPNSVKNTFFFSTDKRLRHVMSTDIIDHLMTRQRDSQAPAPGALLSRDVLSLLVLEDLKPEFSEPTIEVNPGIWIQLVDPQFLAKLESYGLHNGRELLANHKIVLQSHGTSATHDLMRPQALATSLVLSTNAQVKVAIRILLDRSLDPVVVTEPSPITAIGWGHYRDTLTLQDIDQAKPLLGQIEHLEVRDSFSRVSNALLFYENRYNSHIADSALIAFTTCLESLFSTDIQEISFRLSHRLAVFLTDNVEEREKLYSDCREVYSARSKVVHGAPIRHDLEQAAIYLVEGIVPTAEQLARAALLRILTLHLESVFDSSKRLNALFDKLMFGRTLQDALSTLPSRED